MRRFGLCLSLLLWGGQGALTHSSVWLLGIMLHTSAASHIWLSSSGPGSCPLCLPIVVPKVCFFQPVIGCFWILQCCHITPKAILFIMTCPRLYCHQHTINLPFSTQRKSSHTPCPITFPPSLPSGLLPSSCQAWRRVTSGMENYFRPSPALPSIYSQMACWF